MSKDVHSVDFYKQLALSKADLDKSGDINTEEEQSIFDDSMSTFDMNGDGKVNEEDVPLFQQSVTMSAEEQEKMKLLEKFNSEHPDFNPETASAEDLKAYNEVLSQVPYDKFQKKNDFNKDVIGSVDYFIKTGKFTKLMEYGGAIVKHLGINGQQEETTNDETAPSPTEAAPVKEEETKVEPQKVEPQVTEPVVPETPAKENEPAPASGNMVTDVPPPADNVNPSPVTNTSANPVYGGGSATGRVTSNPVKTLNMMTLDELEAEKTKRETKLKDARATFNDANTEANPKIKEAKQLRNTAKDEYLKAVKEDEGIRVFRSIIEKNLKSIEKNEKDIIENTEKITKNETELSKQETLVNSAKSDLSALEQALSSLPQVTGKEEDKEKDQKIKYKKDTITIKIYKQKKEVEKQEKNLNKLNREKEELQTVKAKLEDEKKLLEQYKEKIDETVKKYSNEHTQQKLEAFNSAQKKYTDVKASEISNARTELDKANTAVAEVNTRIDEVRSMQIKRENSFYEAPDISQIPAADRKKWGVSEKTLPNGMKVLACSWSRFSKCQPEWIEQQECMQKAAQDLGITILYSDAERTVAESNAGRARKGSLVVAGGNSPHNYGVACDIVLYKDGKAVGVNSQLQTDFARLAQQYSGGKITWGGDWTKAGERHHFELAEWRENYKTKENLVG